MLNYNEFVLIILLAILFFVLLFLSTGIIYNKEGYVSVIKVNKEVYIIEDRKLSYYLPLFYHKVGYYPIKFTNYKIKNRTITLSVIDPISLARDKVKIKKILKQKNPKKILRTYPIIVK